MLGCWKVESLSCSNFPLRLGHHFSRRHVLTCTSSKCVAPRGVGTKLSEWNQAQYLTSVVAKTIASFIMMLVRNFASTYQIWALHGPESLNNDSRGRSPWLTVPSPAFRREPRRRRGSQRIKSRVPPTPDFIRGYRNSGPPGHVQIENIVMYLLAKMPINIFFSLGQRGRSILVLETESEMKTLIGKQFPLGS
jgi:hypothetical protein